jgi:hypothetical protein
MWVSRKKGSDFFYLDEFYEKDPWSGMRRREVDLDMTHLHS